MLADKSYVPILKTNVAEMSAYRVLFPSVKPLVFPLFLFRPWQNANDLNMAVEKVQEAVEGHPFALCLDARKRGYSSKRAAQADFDALFETRLGYRRYYNFIRDVEGAVPVLIPTNDPDILLHQIGNAADLNRGLIIHQNRDHQIPLSDAILNLDPLPLDTVFVLDAGWSKQYLSMESWVIPMVERILNALPQAEIVIAASSFPDNFSHIVGTKEEAAHERRLFAAVRQRFNSADLTYGDWGSTRLTNKGGAGDAIPSRIDIPRSASWQIFRADPDNDLGFSEMAWEATHHESFQDVPDCWGKQMVLASDDMGAGIQTRPVATQARVNMHMTMQSGASSLLPTDEIPYAD
jgi:hypothetical protein